MNAAANDQIGLTILAEANGEQFCHIPVLGQNLFQVIRGAPADKVGDHADLLLHLATKMLAWEADSPDSDRACVIQLLIEQARACHRAIGIAQ